MRELKQSARQPQFNVLNSIAYFSFTAAVVL